MLTTRQNKSFKLADLSLTEFENLLKFIKKYRMN